MGYRIGTRGGLPSLPARHPRQQVRFRGEVCGESGGLELVGQLDPKGPARKPVDLGAGGKGNDVEDIVVQGVVHPDAGGQSSNG